MANKYFDFIEECDGQTYDDRLYYEVHHIIPRRCGGNNSKDNLIKLTGEQHFVAHKLLIEVWPCQATYAAGGGMLFKKCLTPDEYGEAKEFQSLSMRGENNPMYGINSETLMTPEAVASKRQKLSDASSGENNGMFGKTGEKSPNYGSKRTKEERARMSSAQTGDKNHRYGHKYSEEESKKLSIACGDNSIHHFYNFRTQESVFAKYKNVAKSPINLGYVSVKELRKGRKRQIKGWIYVGTV